MQKRLHKKTGSIYLDLSKASVIGGNYISGGLASIRAYKEWEDNTTTLIIDALDEARVRVSGQAFSDFIQDIICTCEGRNIPIVLLGRTGVIDETILNLLEYKFNPFVLDIEYFDKERSCAFVCEYIFSTKEDSKNKGSTITTLKKHKEELQKCVARIVDLLERFDGDGDDRNFSGYAPVLQAISIFIKESGGNIAQINTEIDEIISNKVLERICRTILLREQEKLIKQIEDKIANVTDDLYNVNEQMAYLVNGKISDANIETYGLTGSELSCYTDAVNSLFKEHPFMDGQFNLPVNIVFEAAILSHALKKHNANPYNNKNIDNKYISKIFCSRANPLLAEFYFNDDAIFYDEVHKETGVTSIAAKDIGPLYYSYIARASQGSRVEVSLELSDDSSGKIVEGTFSQYDGGNGKETVIKNFCLDNNRTVYFFDFISGIRIDCPSIEVEIGEIGAERDILLHAPLEMSVKSVAWLCNSLFVYSGKHDLENIEIESVEEPVYSPKKIQLYNDAVFLVKWPNSNAYPWTEVSQINFDQNTSDKMQQAFFSFCKIIRLFRSHSKGSLARYKDKIDHKRMTKGYGEKIKEKLLEDGIIYEKGNMYHINQEIFDSKIGMTYLDISKKKINKSVEKYLGSIL